MEVNERIVEIIRQKGPMLPAHVSKETNDSLLITSARLSELFSNRRIKISNLKVGGSPLYYMQGQESKLQNFSGNLAEREREAFGILKDRKVLRDTTQAPAIRFALRQIKDFSVPLEVEFEGKTELFWKWYLTEASEAQGLIGALLSGKEKPKETTVKTEIPQEPKEIPTKEIKTEIAAEKAEKQKTLKEKTGEAKKIPKEKTEEPLFLKHAKNFFDKNKVNVIESIEPKKNSETDFIIELQTPMGNARYFCKAKNKKKISEADLSSALIQAQSKNLPLVFLTDGKIAKKAEERLKTDFRNILYKEI